jgi:hypothetical protein
MVIDMILSRFAFACALGFMAYPAVAADLYVDQAIAADCADYSPTTRACGQGEAEGYATLGSAMGSLRPGDTLNLRSGEYGQLNPAVSGTPESPIEIRSAAEEAVTITTDGEVALWLVDRSYIRIAGIAVSEVEGFGRLENSTGIVIDNVRFGKSLAGGTTGSLKLVRSSENRILNSTFDSGSDLLLLQDDSDRNVLSGNRFGRAAHSQISIRCSSHNVIRNNYFENPDQKAMELFDCEGVSDAPVRLDDARRNVVEFNLFNGTARAGRNHRYNAIQHGGQQNIVRYNVFSNNLGGGVNYQFYRMESLFVYGNRLYNNTFYNNRCHAIIGQSGSSNRFKDNRVVNNLLYQNLDCGGSDEQTSIENGRQVILLRNAEVNADPGFINASSGDLALQAGSNQVDAGSFVAKAVTSGSGNTLPVDDASWFHDGLGIPGETGDLIQIEGQSTPSEIVGIDYSTNTLTLVAEATWRRGDGIHLAFSGRAPDMGAFEHGATQNRAGPDAEPD